MTHGWRTRHARCLRFTFHVLLSAFMSKGTLLIVDDEKPTREGLRTALEDRYEVYIAVAASSAI